MLFSPLLVSALFPAGLAVAALLGVSALLGALATGSPRAPAFLRRALFAGLGVLITSGGCALVVA